VRDPKARRSLIILQSALVGGVSRRYELAVTLIFGDSHRCSKTAGNASGRKSGLDSGHGTIAGIPKGKRFVRPSCGTFRGTLSNRSRKAKQFSHLRSGGGGNRTPVRRCIPERVYECSR